MAIASLQGSLSTTYTPPDGVRNDYVEGTDLPVSPDPRDRVVQTKTYKDAVDLGSVLDQEVFGHVFQAIQAYVTGTNVEVTYYRKNYDAGSRVSDTQNEDIESIHDTYQRINGMVLKFSDDLQYSYASDTNDSTISGTAVMLPGVVPKAGDFYLYEVEPGKYGKFNLTNVNRLSIRSTSCHEITVRLAAWVDTTDIEAIEDKVASVLYFDTEAYLSESKALLLTDEKVMLDDTRNLLGTVLHDYLREFTDTDVLHSLVSPAEEPVHDPYLVKFIAKYAPWDGLRPHELVRDPEGYEFSYWYGLENPGRVSVAQFLSKYLVEDHTHASRDTHVTSLINKKVVVLTTTDDEDGIDYISEGLGDIVAPQSDFDSLVRLYIEQQKIDPIELLTQANDIASLTADERFYRVPVFYYLLKVLERHLLTGHLREYTASSQEYGPTIYDFVEDDLVDGWLVMKYSSPVLSITDEVPATHYLEAAELVYNQTTSTTHIDIATMITRLGLTFTGTWSVVLTGVLG